MSGWIEEIRQGLFLSPAGVLILVDHAVPVRLGALVRALLADYPDLDVFTDVAELEGASDGATIVFLPKASDAEWLNLNRPMFARKALKVVLFSEREVTEALSRKAPDFYDWISHRQECPAGVAEHAVWGIRKALLARAPGILFLAHRDRRDRIEHVERVFQEALPGRRLLWLKPHETTFLDLVDQIRSAGRKWAACDALSNEEAERFRWALAEAGRRTRALIVVPEVFDDWFWSISDALFGAASEAIALLREAGAQHPGRMAAVTGLEGPVIASLAELLVRGHREEVLLRTMLRAPDPGAALAETILAAGIEERPLQGFFTSAPVQRHLGNLVGLRRLFQGPKTRTIGRVTLHFGTAGPPLMRAKADRVEYILRREKRTVEHLLEISRLALEHGDPEAAEAWVERALPAHEPKPIVMHTKSVEEDFGDGALRILVLLALDRPGEALDLADLELTRTAAQWPRMNHRLLSWISLLARSLGRAGRARDAEVLLRKLLGLPIEIDTNAFALGLSSREVLLAFLNAPRVALMMVPELRRELWESLVQALRAQGRHQEADALKPSPKKNTPPSSH